MEIKF